jgi:hypothetical protein
MAGRGPRVMPSHFRSESVTTDFSQEWYVLQNLWPLNNANTKLAAIPPQQNAEKSLRAMNYARLSWQKALEFLLYLHFCHMN